MGGMSSDHRSSTPMSPSTATPAASDAVTRPQRNRRISWAVPRIRTDAVLGSRHTTLSPWADRSSHHWSLRSVHSKAIVGPAGALTAARDAATKTSRYSSTPSAAISGATENACPRAVSASQQWMTASNAIRRAHQSARPPDAHHDQHSASAGTPESCRRSEAVPVRNHSTNSGESLAGVCSSLNRPKSASGRLRMISATTWCVPATCRATVPTVQRSDHRTDACGSRSVRVHDARGFTRDDRGVFKCHAGRSLVNITIVIITRVIRRQSEARRPHSPSVG